MTALAQTALFSSSDAKDASLKQRRKLTFRGNANVGRHGWLRLTPAYSLHIVQSILEDRNTDDFVLDPFSGTATTALSSATLGIPAHGVDVNPFLVWFGNLKVKNYPKDFPRKFEIAANKSVKKMRARKRWGFVWTPDIYKIDRWWDEATLKALSRLFFVISEDYKNNRRIKHLLRVAFCRAAIETSQASFNHQSMSFKKKSAEVSGMINTDHQVEMVIRKFLGAAKEIADSVAAEPVVAPADVFLGDARTLDGLEESRYTKVITSPPYPNRMSYVRELRPYMYWTGFLKSGRQAGELDWDAIGGTWGCATSNLGRWEADRLTAIPFREFEQIVSAISENHELLGKYVHKYFQDIAQHIQSLLKVLKPGARCYYIVGNSKFYGTLLPVERIYESLFKDLGYTNTRVERIRKRNSKKELYEFLVYAEAPR